MSGEGQGQWSTMAAGNAAGIMALATTFRCVPFNPAGPPHVPSSTSYELLDFGRGRKLERFGEVLLDRPSPAAEEAAVQSPALWNAAHARFDRAGGA